MTLRIRPDIESLPAYKAGQKLVSKDGSRTYKLSSNENPYPPLPSVVEAISAAASEINRYPDPLNTELVAALAARHQVLPEQIALSTGSVALLGNIIQSMAAPGDEVVYAWRSFEAYPIWAQISGVKSVQVPLRENFTHDLEAMAAAVSCDTRVILLCSPNNPTGTTIGRAELHDFMSKIAYDVLVVIDEAYCEFVRDENAAAGMDFFRQYPNVALLRTFSKAYGLAGLRVGYSIAPVELADYLRRTALPFGVSSLAQTAALASLAAEDELLTRVDALTIERERVATALVAQGWNVAGQQANFLWIPSAGRTAELQVACEKVGVAVRPFPDGLRVSIGETEANDRIISALSTLI